MSFVKPILQDFETLLKANLNTQIAVNDATAPTVDATAYALANVIFPSRLFVSIFTAGESTVVEEETGGTIYVSFPIYVALNIVARDEVRLLELADVYNTSVVQALTSSAWSTTNTEKISLISLGYVLPEEESGNVVGGCYTQWAAYRVIDPSA